MFDAKLNIWYRLECSKLTDEYIAIIDKLKAQKLICPKSYSQLANEIDLSESTVMRILTGKSTNPAISDVIALWKAMGGKATELFDDKMKVDVVSEAPQVVVPQVDERLYTEIINIYKDMIKSKDKWIKILFALVSGLVLFIIAIVVIDLLHGDLGYVRY
jgi:hypothetical protein